MHNRYLEILKLQPGASKKDIKSAYRRLSKQYHPDVNKNEDAEEQFIEINEAYKFLMEVGPKPQQQQTAYDYDPMADEYARWRARARQYAWEKAREAQQQRNELIQQILARFNYLAVFIITFNVVLGIDYLLPLKELNLRILNISKSMEDRNSRSGKSMESYYDKMYFENFIIQFESGEIWYAKHEDLAKVYVTPFFGKPMEVVVNIDGNHFTYQKIINIYTVFGFVIPVIIFIYLLYLFVLRTTDGKLTLATFISFFFLVQLFLFFRF